MGAVSAAVIDRAGPADRARGKVRGSLAGALSSEGLEVWVTLAALTTAGLVLRAIDMGQSLYGDERYTYSIVTANGASGVWHQVYTTSITPPLHYYLAWLAIKLGGSATVMVRVPSLVLGTAAILLVFAIGRRVGGSAVGLVAAGLLALSPFAIFYSTEARAYETVVFLIAVGIYALLRAHDGRWTGWWALYALASCAALWAHYTAVFVLIACALWSFACRPSTRRQLVLAETAIVLLYLPWLPGYIHQRHNSGLQLFNQFSSLTPGTVAGFPLRTLVARPYVALTTLPGTLGLVLIGLLIALAAAAAARRPRLSPRLSWLASERGLMLILALATPVGLVLYALAGTTLFASDRELSASEPALVVLVALVLVGLARAVNRRLAVALLAAAGAVFAATAVRSAGSTYQRPPYNAVAAYLDHIGGASPVVEEALAVSADARLRGSTLSLYLHRARPLYTARHNDSPAWEAARTGAPVFMLRGLQPAVLHAQGLDLDTPAVKARMARFGGPNGRDIVRETRTFPGFYPLVLQRMQGLVQGRLAAAGGHEAISWTLNRHVIVDPGFARGAIAGVTPSGGPLLIGGWALRAATLRPVDWIMFFAGGRLFALSPGGIPDRALARAHGRQALLGGWGIAPLDGPSDHAQIRVFAVSGNRASELPWSAAARRELGR